MRIDFRRLDVAGDFDVALRFRRDSYHCSFGSLDGFDDEVGIDGALYRAKLEQRAHDPRWFYFHLWFDDAIIGQLEFRSFSDWPERGYVHLFYLAPAWRGKRLFRRLHAYVAVVLKAQGCGGAALSVSRTNQAALRAYARLGWYRHGVNPKHALTDFYFNDFR